MTPALRTQVLRELRPYAGPPVQPTGRTAEQLVPQVMKKLGLEQRLHQSQVFFLWARIVGPDIAQHAQPVRLKNARLEVTVDHPIWLQELSRYHKKLLLEKVQQAVGKQAVRDIYFRIG